jgi:hypothetical protein
VRKSSGSTPTLSPEPFSTTEAVYITANSLHAVAGPTYAQFPNSSLCVTVRPRSRASVSPTDAPPTPAKSEVSLSDSATASISPTVLSHIASAASLVSATSSATVVASTPATSDPTPTPLSLPRASLTPTQSVGLSSDGASKHSNSALLLPALTVCDGEDGSDGEEEEDGEWELAV